MDFFFRAYEKDSPPPPAHSLNAFISADKYIFFFLNVFCLIRICLSSYGKLMYFSHSSWMFSLSVFSFWISRFFCPLLRYHSPGLSVFSRHQYYCINCHFNHTSFPFTMLQDALTLVFIQICNCTAADFVIISTKHQYSEIIISAGSQPCSSASHCHTSSLSSQMILARRNTAFSASSIFLPREISPSCLIPSPLPCTAIFLHPLLYKTYCLQLRF